MAIVHALPLYQPPVPVHNVQRQSAYRPPAGIACRPAPPLKRERPPETLQDYAGAATFFVPISAAALLMTAADRESMPDDAKPPCAMSLYFYVAVVGLACAVVTEAARP